MQFVPKLFELKTSRTRASKSGRPKSKINHRVSYDTLEPRQLLATIGWTSGDITGSSDISTNGSLVFAINGSDESGTTTTVNGVNFVSSIPDNSLSRSQSQSPGSEAISTTLGNNDGGAFTNGGLGVTGALIRGGWWGVENGSSATVTLSGLSVGDDYEIQVFASDARTTRHNGYVSRLDNGAGGTGVDLQLNNRPLGGLAGDFGIGTFTADGTTQTFNITGFINGNSSSSRIQVNAIQLRKITPIELLPGAHPLINEFSASNSSVLDDDNGNSTDWIEIFNAGQDPVNLAGYSLSDDLTDTSKYVFPSTTLAGGQYLVVFAGDDADPATGSDLYTGFGLSSGGEHLGFYDSAGNLVTEFGTGGADYPAQFTDVSYGFLFDDTYSVPSFFATPTPGSANVGSVDGVVDELPTVSVERGFYDTAFDVDIALQTPGLSVVYTTDGTTPSLTNGTRVDPANSNSLVQFTLNISETTSLRTAAVRDGFLTSDTTTHTYIFLNDVITSDVLDPSITNQYTNAELRAGLLDIPTLSFNFETLIVDTDQPEQRASIEWLAPDGSAGFQIDAGISGFGGNHPTSQGFEKENYRVEFRNSYDGRLEFPLFEGFDNGVTATESFESIEFRGGSHDRILRGFGLSNRFVDDTLLELGHAVPHGRFVHIYYNGEYFGQFHMRERWDADFLAQYYGGEEDDYEAVNGNVNNGQGTPNGWDPGDPYDGDGTAWAAIQALADTAGNITPQGPTGGYQELKEVVNLPQYLDFALLYMAGNTENEYRGGGSVDGSVPYTFYLNDADGWIRSIGDRTGNAGPGNILGTLVAEGDPEFLTLYADRIQNMFGEGGVLSPERSVERLQNRIDETQLSFVLESARYVSPDNETRTPQSFAAAANNAIENILPAIPVDMINRLRARGLFPSIDAPSFIVDNVFQNGGEIDSGDVLTFNADQTVYYTVNGTDPRLVGGGINPNAILYNPGLTSTTIIPLGSVWNYEDSGNDLGTAWRNSNFNDSGWASGPGELGYGDDDESTVVNFVLDGQGNKNATTYFRKTFNVAAGNYTSASFDLKRDDGAAVYLNGNLLFRTSNLPAGAAFDDYATSTADGTVSFTFNPDLLQVGSNTLAVEIHQASGTSSDISFDARVTLSGVASTSSTPVTLNESTNVKARSFSGGQWSGIRDATFVIPGSQLDLRISEIHFNPADPTAAEMLAGFIDNDDFEFIELFNPSGGTINLSGVQLSDGVTFDFGDTNLFPGERAVVVEDIDAFMARYGDSANVLGQWSGSLSNGGEEVTLLDNSLTEIMSVNYGDNDPWYGVTDGDGYSLVLEDPANTPVTELGKYYSWRASSEFGGTPGTSSTSPSGIVINEVVAHTDVPQSDAIELYNPTGQAIDVSFWFLSDSITSPFKFRIPADTIIPSGGYLVYDESDFNLNPTNPGVNDFALSSNGDNVVLSRPTIVSGSVSTFVEDSVSFGATFNGESLGLLPNGSGQLSRLAATSLGSANGDTEVGPLVISEVNYHPDSPNSAALAIDPLLTDNDLEYIEIANPTSSAIDLTNWRVRGEADYDFAAGTSLAAGAAIVLVSFDPSLAINASKLAAFEAHYGIGSGVTIVGGLSATLSNGTGRISLQQPDAPDSLGDISHVVVDELIYDDLAPWPDADGSGLVLERDDVSASGLLSGSWTAAAATPGIFDHDFLCGDINQDGFVTFLDISPFIDLLTNDTYQVEADFDNDGLVTFLDIAGLIDKLTAQ